MVDYIAMCYFFGGILGIFGGCLWMMFAYEDVDRRVGPTKAQRKDIRIGWYGIIGALFAPITLTALILAAPFALCYGGYRLVKGPLRRSLNDAFGREAVEE